MSTAGRAMSNARAHQKGCYIVVEGIDGSGKSLLVRKLAALIEKERMASEVVITKEPGGTELGKTLRALVQARKALICDQAEFLLFAADRAQHIRSVVTPALEQDKIVISDRSFISSIAYQGFGRGLDCDIITTVNEWVLNGVVPNVIVYLELDPMVAHARIEERNEARTAFEQEQQDFWARVIDGFDHCCKRYPQMIRIDATQTVDAVVWQAFNAVKKQMSTFLNVD